MALFSAFLKDGLRLYIISSLPEVTEYVRSFAHHFNHSIVGYSFYFESYLEDIIDKQPDVVICASYICDINTPTLIQMLEHHKDLQNTAVVAVHLMTERYMSTKFTAFMPFEVFSFERMLRAAIKEKRTKCKPVYLMTEEKKIRKRITNLLHHLAMSSDLEGYRFAHRALEIAMEDTNNIRNLSKNIYPIIAKEFNSTEKYVDKMINNAIISSWLKCPIEVQQEIFGNSASISPSTKVYLSTLAEHLCNDADEDLPDEAALFRNYYYK